MKTTPVSRPASAAHPVARTGLPSEGWRRDALTGARAMAPWLVGIVPFGLVIGVSAARANIPTFAGWLAGPAIFGGSAQVAVINLLDAGTTPAVIIVSALAVNLRLVLYSAAMAPRWQDTPRWWRALAAYLLIDQSVMVGMDAYDHSADVRRGHRVYLGGAAFLWLAWISAIGIGATAGVALPAALRLELVIPLFLAGEVAKRMTGRPERYAVAAAVAVSLVAFGVPFQLGPLLAIVAGIAAGLHAAGFKPSRVRR